MKSFLIHLALIGFAAAGSLYAGDKDKVQEKLEHKIVDSGSFGIFLGGRRIGTETFKIEQRPDLGVITAEIKVNDGKSQAVQSAEMRVAPNGELRSYTWHSSVPQVEEANVEPQNELLVEHLVFADQKKKDVQHMLSPQTAILDDNFFSHREVLLWRYLQTGCKWKDGVGRLCGPSSYAVFVPQQHSSINATLSLLGTDKVMVKGVERVLNKVALQLGESKQLVIMNGSNETDSNQWVLWVDDDFKIVKITVPGSNIEVVRD